MSRFIGIFMLAVAVAPAIYARKESRVSGSVVSTEKEKVGWAIISVKDTDFRCTTNEHGEFNIELPKGRHTLIVTALGYVPLEREVEVREEDTHHFKLRLTSGEHRLNEVAVVSNGVGRLKRNAYNTVAIDTKALGNTTKTLGDALAKAPGIKIRESGGVGSDMQLSLDGFSGKYVKVFIDGVPQEGVGRSFGLNNIPVSLAERIEVYKGVVPVGFGTDAIGGVVNIVTGQRRRSSFLDASYSYGSFNTHRTTLHFGQTTSNGFTYEVNAFQNYSDNNYKVDVPIEDFTTGRIDRTKRERVERFHDTYHNESVVAKAGFAGKSWADRFLIGMTYARQSAEIQNGVRQEIVYGARTRSGYSLIPSLTYVKHNLFTHGLSLTLNGTYVRNLSTLIDTSSVKYNWRGETTLLNSPGEQSYQHLRTTQDNWNATGTLAYRISEQHHFTLNHVFTHFTRTNTSFLAKERNQDAIDKQTAKHITGFAYLFTPSDRWNVSIFAKHYAQNVSGPQAVDGNQTNFVRSSRHVSTFGYGAATSAFILKNVQAKLSYEKAYRLPTIEEMFGDEDLERGDLGIRPEYSHNLNFNISYHFRHDRHSVFAEGGFVLRDTRDYIQRNIEGIGGGRQAASYVNYGKVLTKGVNLSLRYDYGRKVSIGGNFTMMDVRDNQRIAIGSTQTNHGYKSRMPNLPYSFADMDVTYHIHDFLQRGNKLSVTYDNQYLHSFSYYNARFGSNTNEWTVPGQFSHNLTLTYSMMRGRYHISVECRNLTDERLYDNFSLQKAGRALYAKFRLSLGGGKTTKGKSK